MTPEEDRSIAREAARTPLTVRLTRDQAGAMMRTWARDNPPKRFAVCSFAEDERGHDCALIAWGLEFDDHLMAQSVDSRVHGTFSSPDSLLAVLGNPATLELVRLDPAASVP
ncbi:hypothetical protein ACFWY9_14655 [Amycolatopsis sp. NPDC059027]|uniref:hypothetical protein n=1 Tax=unclassified Amycolatopsis TaxID=2618356 RepID=UPI00366FC560